MLKLLSVAAIPVAAQSVQASEPDGYGTGGYGDGAYGGETGDEGSDDSDDEDDGDNPDEDEGDDLFEDDDDEAEDDEEAIDEELPEIDEYHVEEDSPPNPHAEIHASWSVSSPESPLELVLIEVFEQSDEQSPVDSEVIDVSGPAESGTVSFTVSHGSGDSYRVSLEVRNDAGHTVIDERVVEAI